MRLIEGSLRVTCLASGQWSQLPVCQSYTYGCRRTKVAHEYMGKVNKTRCGNPCQAWGSSTPNRPSTDVRNGFTNPQMFPEYKNVFEAENFCRNPDKDEQSGPWCYLAQNVNEKRWGYCDIPYCDGSDTMADYERMPGACDCDGEWYNAVRNFGTIKTMEGASLPVCKRDCDANPECQGMVYDENRNTCWLKKCKCSDSQVTCDNYKHQSYFRRISRKTSDTVLSVKINFLFPFFAAKCPGAEYRDTRNNVRRCYFSLFNFNLTNSSIFDWNTSRRLCQQLFPIDSDIASLETADEFNNFAQLVDSLKLPVTYPRVWMGLSRPVNMSDAWVWASQNQTYSRNQIEYARWGSREPSNGYEEQCAQIILRPEGREVATDIGKWADVNCRSRAPVVCEARLPNF